MATTRSPDSVAVATAWTLTICSWALSQSVESNTSTIERCGMSKRRAVEDDVAVVVHGGNDGRVLREQDGVLVADAVHHVACQETRVADLVLLCASGAETVT